MNELTENRRKLLITVVGIGGCGCNPVDMLSKNNFSDSVNLLAVNTDPDVGLKAAQESEEQLRDAIKDSQIVIITAGFGGGTGTGASPFVAKIPRELGINCLAIVTLPFMSESKMRMDYALQGVEEIKQVAQAHITLSNDLLLKGIGENVGLFSAFNQSNEVLKNLFSALVQMLTQTGFINVDINDFSRIMSFEGQSILGVGKADSEDLALDSLAQALNNPLVSSADISSAQGIIIQIFCKKEITVATYDSLINKIRVELSDDKALVIATGLDQ